MRTAVVRSRCLTLCVQQGTTQHSKPTPSVYRPLFRSDFIDVRPVRKYIGRSYTQHTFVTVPRAAAASAVVASLPPMLQAVLSPAALAITILSTVVISTWASIRRKTRLSEITAEPSAFNRGVLSRCPTINSPYQAWPFLTNGHVETIFASKTRRSPPVLYDRESFRTPDGGTVHLDYHRVPSSTVGSSLHLNSSMSTLKLPALLVQVCNIIPTWSNLIYNIQF